MAGLQQYNFFPTDFFYPRPQPSAKPTVIPLQTPDGEIISTEDPQLQNQQEKQKPRSLIKIPPTSALVNNRKKQSLSGVDKKQSKFSASPLSWMVWIEEEEGSGTF